MRTAPGALFRTGLLSAAVAMAMLPSRGIAQTMDPNMDMSMPMPAAKPTPTKKAIPKPKAKPAPTMDHSKMEMSMPMPAAKRAPVKQSPPARKPATKPKPKPKPAPVMDPSMMNMPMPTTPADTQAMAPGMPMPMDMPMDPSAMPGMTVEDKTAAPTEPVTPIPELTDADRAAAEPLSNGMAVHDNTTKRYVLLDRLETWNADRGTGLQWDGRAWIGTDLNRLWLRSEGARVGGVTEEADLEVLYGRSVARWWDVVAGLRHDFKPGASQDFAAIGVIGMAPYKFDVEATAYIGQSGQTEVRLEAEYETLLTNRLILQPRIEANLFGRNDARRGIGSGLGTIEAGFRLRYEITRQFAPYIGIVRERAFGNTADLRRSAVQDINDTRFVAGLRIWF